MVTRAWRFKANIQRKQLHRQAVQQITTTTKNKQQQLQQRTDEMIIAVM